MPQENRRIAIWIGCVLAAWTVWILSWFGVVPDFGGALPVLAFMGLMLCGHAATLWIMADTLRQPPRPKLRDARAAPRPNPGQSGWGCTSG